MKRLERHIERDLRQIADRATPSPNAWNSILTRIADQAPDTETEIIMLTETTPTTTRRWLPIAATAAVIALVVAGIAITINTSSDDGESPSPAATTVAATTIAPRTQTGSFAGGDGVPVTFAVPDGWTVFEGWLVHDFRADPTSVAGVAFWDVRNIYAEGCQWVLLDPPLGPTIDDLVSALANVPAYAATAAVDVTVDGFVGKQIEFTVPDYNKDECKEKTGGGVFGLWQESGDLDVSEGPQFWAQGAKMHNTLYILDVNGTRLVIDVYSLPAASPEDLAALDAVLASVQIG